MRSNALRDGTHLAIEDLLDSLSHEGVSDEWAAEHASLSRVASYPTVETLATEDIALGELRAWALGRLDEEEHDAADVLVDCARAELVQQRRGGGIA